MRVGITGSYASGKGTITRMLVNLGAREIDTDIIAREIMEPGSPVLQQVIELFGNEFLDESGNLRRRELAVHVFQDDKKTAALNKITHGAIHDITMERSADTNIYAINVPLLFESGFDRSMDYNVLVAVEGKENIERGMERDGISREEVLLRLNHQMELSEKKKHADYIIDNSYTLENTERQVKELWKILTKMNST